MTACADRNSPPDVQPIPEIHSVYPKIDANLLVCPSEPSPGQISTDIQAAMFTEDVRKSGADCRQKLSKIKAFVDSWPQPTP